MTPFKVSELLKVVKHVTFSLKKDIAIHDVFIDSRKVIDAPNSLFIAMAGALHDGHEFIVDCISKGVQTFIITNPSYINPTAEVNYILVENSITALQEIAIFERAKHTIPIIGVTGSNGKTTIKEWLSYLLSKKYNVVKSPGSYNSQIGVPLSVLQLTNKHDFGVFEAGISKPNEMQKLHEIIAPTIGIFSNIGEAHSEGFLNQKEKIREKFKLFTNAKKIIISADHEPIINEAIALGLQEKLVTWGESIKSSLFVIKRVSINGSKAHVQLSYNQQEYGIDLNLTDSGSLQNVFHCIATLLTVGYEMEECISIIAEIFPIPMRLNMSKGKDDCTIINDAYNHDLTSLKNALEFLHQQKGRHPSLAIISDIEESQMSSVERVEAIRSLLNQYPVDTIWWIGNQKPSFANKTFTDRSEVEKDIFNEEFTSHYILIKGARKHRLELLKTILENKSHSARLEIDLASLDHNLQYYAKYLHGDTGIIAVVKAGAYGSGSEQLARLLQYRGVKYLAVAFADEGIDLRKHGITMPIMVLNPDQYSFHQLFRYNLEPEIYGLSQLKEFIKISQSYHHALPIHLKLDSGMNRLGFKEYDLPDAIDLIVQSGIKINTMFSHLAGSEDPSEDDFSNQQYQTFMQMVNRVKTSLNYSPKIHFLNTGGIIRFPAYHHDFVRLGLGMYGIDTTKSIKLKLEKVHTFTASIIQTKWVEPNQKIGYNQKGIATHKMKIGIINVGYADGVPRNVGCGKFAVYIDGNSAPIVGNVCMDLTIIDLTNSTSSTEGDLVEIFGKNNPIEKLAKAADTIPYEILSRISSRVKKEWVV